VLALKGADNLDFVLDHRLFQPVSTPEIEALYERLAPGMQNSFEFVTRAQVEEGGLKKEQLLLTADAHTDVSSSLQVPELSGEVERAIWQVEQAAIKAEKEKEQAEKDQEDKRQQVAQELAANEKHEQRK
jgi:hypothetical protein